MSSREPVTYCVRTDIGLRRKRNEDSYLVADRRDPLLGSLWAVADGMGGHPDGDLASRLVCRYLEELYFSSPSFKEALLYRLRPRALLSRLEKCVEEVQKRLLEYEKKHPESEGFGTTLSVLVLRGGHGFIAHVGDSRIYRLRHGDLTQLTTDDTLVQEMVEEGEMTEEEARTSRYRHILTQALGGGYEKVRCFSIDIRPGDLYLLSTDGLHDLVPGTSIRKILLENPLPRVCDMLVEAALARGGRDNVTVIVVRIEG
ncbi:protein phosphatase 2C domain-containing protein [Thermosulfurimonas sp.]|uniref:PP2C family protein-serine/threonine phosphatase n=1 Tax=Thermosulfurimonas sp. TaxID=2080236 RepID=UPI0025EB82FC|nr:protein phosphatase 2C domain-containing protein [Thermosulfurimonas sp.]